MNPANAYLNAEGLQALQSGHPWLTTKHFLKSVHLPKVPCVFPLAGEVYFLSPESHLRLRRLDCPGKFDLSGPIVTPTEFAATFAAVLRENFTGLFMQKQKLVNGDKLFRWIFAENDGVPGLVVDVFEDILVCQIQSAPLEVFWPVFRDCLEAAFSDATGAAPRTLVEKRNAPVRAKEGLPIVGQDAIRGEPVVEAQYFWNGLKWWMTPGHSQKTGAYLDQRSNHGRAVEWARRLGIRQALDVCSFEGGFGLHLLKAGLQVTAVDVSASALAGMRRNAELNAFNAQNLETVQRDAFEFLRDHHKSGMQAEMISLDPPPFARNKEQKDAALRGFYDLNLRAVLCLKPGGLLVSCSCSHAVQGTEMKRMFKKIARSTGRPLKVLEVLGPAPDHAAALHFPEGEYLSAWFVLT